MAVFVLEPFKSSKTLKVTPCKKQHIHVRQTSSVMCFIQTYLTVDLNVLKRNAENIYVQPVRERLERISVLSFFFPENSIFLKLLTFIRPVFTQDDYNVSSTKTANCDSKYTRNDDIPLVKAGQLWFSRLCSS